MSRRADKRLRGLVAGLAVVCVAALAGGASASHNASEQVSLGPAGGNGAEPAQWVGASADGTRVLLRTQEPLVSTDTDTEFDIYERTAGGTTTQLSIGPAGGNLVGADVFYQGASADGSRVVFETFEPLVSSDTDDCEAADPQPNPCSDVYEHSNGSTTLVSAGGNGGFRAQYRGISEDGARVFFTTSEQLSGADTDSVRDIYQRSAGTTTLVSTGSAGGSGNFVPIYRDASADGTRVFFTTEEQLVAADTDSDGDVYERAGGVTTVLSTGPAGGNGAQDASFRGASSDGSRVLIETTEKLVASDTDNSIDVYERSGGTTTLLSTGPAGGNGAKDALVKAWSAGATRVFFETGEQLVGSDTDSSLDVYERSGGTTTLLSTGPAGGNGPFDALLQDVSDDGSRAVIGTAEGLVGSDTDGRIDLYERAGGSTTLLSTGPSGGNGSFDAFFSAASKDGGRVFFETAEQLASDSDVFPDVYERQGGTTTLLSFGTGGGNGAQTAVFTGASDDGYRVWFASAENLASTDTDARTDIFEVRPTASYMRPKGATPVKVPLVVAYDQCTSANGLHGPPAFGAGGPNPSCNPPQPASDYLTIGTPDSNGQQAKSSGFVRLATVVGNPSTPADEADVVMALDLSDVRVQGTLADYTGELQVNVSLRMIDKYSGSSPVDPATMADFTASYQAACTGTPDTTVGSTCTGSTTADALVPGAAIEGVRTIWQLGQVAVLDGGADGSAATTPNTPFMREGIFVP